MSFRLAHPVVASLISGLLAWRLRSPTWAWWSLLGLCLWIAFLLLRQHRSQATLRARDRDHRQAEERLRASEAKFAGLVSIAADAIISTDASQRIIVFNGAAERIFGWTADEVLGRPLDVLLPERARRHHHRLVEGFAGESAGARRMEERREMVGLRKDGREFPADAAISKHQVDGGWLFTVVLRDVTERKREETEREFLLDVGALLASGLDYEEILDDVAHLAVGRLGDCCIVDTLEEDDRPHRVRVAVLDPQQQSLAEALQRLELDPRLPRITTTALESRRPILVEEVGPEFARSVTQSETHLRLLMGLRPASLMVLPLIAHGRLLGAIALLSSDPGRRYGSRDLRFGQELAARAALAMDNARLYRAARWAIAARDEVLAVVAHDLRNPLGIIQMQATQLRRQKKPGPPLQKPAEAIERATRRMNRIIQDLLDVVRMESGHLSVAQARAAPREVLSEAIAAQEALGAAAAIEIRLEVSPSLPDLWVDRDRLFQVLENLLDNALKFTAAGGSITAGAAPRGGDVLFWVADTGRGIAADALPHLFDRFWQAKPGERRGVGLGLAIVKGIVEAHGGRIWVESAPGKGSAFFFTVPGGEAPAKVPATT